MLIRSTRPVFPFTFVCLPDTEELPTRFWLRTWPRLSAHSLILRQPLPFHPHWHCSPRPAPSICCLHIWLFRVNIVATNVHKDQLKIREYSFFFSRCFSMFLITQYVFGAWLQYKVVFGTSGTLSQTCMGLTQLRLRYDTTLDIISNIWKPSGSNVHVLRRNYVYSVQSWPTNIGELWFRVTVAQYAFSEM